MTSVPSILDTADFRHRVLDGVDAISSELSNIQGFQIPEYDELSLTYYGSTNNIETVVYKKDSTVVATLTLTYSVQPPVSNDANLVNVAIS
jgi:hypothetical protein